MYVLLEAINTMTLSILWMKIVSVRVNALKGSVKKNIIINISQSLLKIELKNFYNLQYIIKQSFNNGKLIYFSPNILKHLKCILNIEALILFPRKENVFYYLLCLTAV